MVHVILIFPMIAFKIVLALGVDLQLKIIVVHVMMMIQMIVCKIVLGFGVVKEKWIHVVFVMHCMKVCLISHMVFVIAQVLQMVTH